MIRVETGVGEFRFDTIEELIIFIKSTLVTFKRGKVVIVWDDVKTDE